MVHQQIASSAVEKLLQGVGRAVDSLIVDNLWAFLCRILSGKVGNNVGVLNRDLNNKRDASILRRVQKISVLIREITPLAFQ